MNNKDVEKVSRYVLFFFLLLVILFVIMLRLCGIFVVRGDSMLPSYHSGNVLKTEMTEDISRGDVVVFFHKGKVYIKRVVGIPGDELEIRDGALYVNDVKDMYFVDIENGGNISDSPLLLSDGEYYCMGDNFNESRDCRDLGPISYSELRGVVTNILW